MHKIFLTYAKPSRSHLMVHLTTWILMQPGTVYEFVEIPMIQYFSTVLFLFLGVAWHIFHSALWSHYIYTDILFPHTVFGIWRLLTHYILNSGAQATRREAYSICWKQQRQLAGKLNWHSYLNNLHSSVKLALVFP